MSSCPTALTTLGASCEALKKKGGFDKRFWLGAIADLVPATGVTYGTEQEVTAFTFTGALGFKTYTGKRLKHGAAGTSERGENVSERTQNFNAVLYVRTAAERLALEQLIDAEDLFICAESNAGIIEVYGINKGDNEQFDNYGLNVSATEKNEGVLLNDDTSVKVTLTGVFDNYSLIYNEGTLDATQLATNIAALDAQVV